MTRPDDEQVQVSIVSNRATSTGASRRLAVAALAAAIFAVIGAWAVPAGASDPKSHSVKITKDPGVRTFTWTGEVPPTPTGIVGYATDPCTGDPDLEDQHEIKITLASRVYKSVITTFDFQISWGDAGDDLALSVMGPTGSVGSSDGSDPTEAVAGINLDEGTYSVNVCAFASVGTVEYNGLLKVTTKERPQPKASPTTTEKAAASGSGGSGDSGSGSAGSSGPAPTAPAPRPANSTATPFNSPAFGGSFSTVPAAEPIAADPVQAAPPAFLSTGLDPVESAAAPPRAALRTKATQQIPLAYVAISVVLGLIGLVVALLLRRRRGLDQTPGGSAVVPVTS